MTKFIAWLHSLSLQDVCVQMLLFSFIRTIAIFQPPRSYAGTSCCHPCSPFIQLLFENRISLIPIFITSSLEQTFCFTPSASYQSIVFISFTITTVLVHHYSRLKRIFSVNISHHRQSPTNQSEFTNFLTAFWRSMLNIVCFRYCLSNAMHGIGQNKNHFCLSVCMSKYLSYSIATAVFVRSSSDLKCISNIWQWRVSSMANNTGSKKRACLSIYFRFSLLLGLCLR